MSNVYPVNQQHSEYTLLEALLNQRRKLRYNHPTRTKDFDDITRGVLKNKELRDLPIQRYLGRGASAVVFEMNDGNVIKLTLSNHFPLNRPVEDFDVPIIKKGKIGQLRYYIEQKLVQNGLEETFISIIKERIKQKGYRVSDLGIWDMHQIGISEDGKLYLLDPECAEYKTIFHALFSKLKKFILKSKILKY